LGCSPRSCCRCSRCSQRGFGCSEGECGLLATVLGLLWLPIILAWLVVVGVLLSRWLGKNKS